MPNMKQEDVAHLAELSRIKVSEAEAKELVGDLEAIVSYVSVISDITEQSGSEAPSIGPLHNVFRADEVTNEADAHTADLLAEMPHTEGRYMKVKKILKTDTD